MPADSDSSDDIEEELSEFVRSTEEAGLIRTPTREQQLTQRRIVGNVAAPDEAYSAPKAASSATQRWDAEAERMFVWCKRINTACALLHLSSFIATLTLAICYSSFSQTLVLEGFTSQRAIQYSGSWSVAPLYLVPVYFAISTVAHVVLHFMQKKTWPDRWLLEHRNPLRWIEYSVSAPIMMLCIAILSGLVTYSSLVLVFVCQFMSIVMGWVMESMNPLSRSVTWVPFLLGCVPAVTSWVAVGIPFFASIRHVPAYVIGIYFSVFVCFNVFPVILVYQYKGVRSVRKYITGECIFMLASALAKTVLGWQVVGGTLRP
jgi:hypothetical protein